MSINNIIDKKDNVKYLKGAGYHIRDYLVKSGSYESLKKGFLTKFGKDGYKIFESELEKLTNDHAMEYQQIKKDDNLNRRGFVHKSLTYLANTAFSAYTLLGIVNPLHWLPSLASARFVLPAAAAAANTRKDSYFSWMLAGANLGYMLIPNPIFGLGVGVAGLVYNIYKDYKSKNKIPGKIKQWSQSVEEKLKQYLKTDHVQQKAA